MRKGSITPFCAISLVMVSSLLFAMLESARFCGLGRYATMKAEAAIESVCAEYQPFLWQQYGLLFLDGAYGTGQFSVGYAMEQLGNYMEADDMSEDWLKNWFGVDLFRLQKGEVLLEGYVLAADDGGNLFLNYVAQRMKEKMPWGVAEDLLEQYRKAGAIEKTYDYDGIETTILQAQNAVAQAKEEWVERREEEAEEDIPMPDTSVIDNLLSFAGQLCNGDTLHMIFGNISGISTDATQLDKDMCTREKEEGTMYLKTETDWYRKLLVLTYLETYFSNYRSPKEGHLCYEMEYVLCGKGSETENLEGALERLLLVREAANVAHILADTEKMIQAEEVAGVISLLAGGNYGVVKAVQLGIVGVWAYAESILDVRALVQGEKIPLLKTASDWTLGLNEIFRAWDADVKAKVCGDGLNYTDYLKQLVFMTENQTLAYRMLEVMELGMHRQKKYENCRMDQMIVMLRFKVSLISAPVFSELVAVGETYRGRYIFSKEIERSYIP